MTLPLQAHVGTAIDASIRRIGPNDGNDRELCVPLVVTTGDSIRLAQATTGKGVTPLA